MSFRRAIKSTAAATMRAGAKGVRIEVAGRLNGAEMSRREKEVAGSVPLHTLRADIDYAQVNAQTVAGIIGVKVWIYKGRGATVMLCPNARSTARCVRAGSAAWPPPALRCLRRLRAASPRTGAHYFAPD
jgi:small subunit ribosomal protein S3